MDLPLRHPAPAVQLAMAPRPFSTERVDVTCPAGLTLLEMLTAAQPDPLLLRHCHVFIGDSYVPQELWAKVRPKPGTHVTARVVPSGGGGSGGKNPMRIVLTIAVIIASIYFGPLVATSLGFTAGGTAAAMATATIAAAGMLLVNAIAPIRPPQLGGFGSLGGNSSQDSPTLYVTGSRNQASPFGVIPRPLGRHRMVPPLGTLTYTEVSGNNQYLRMLFVWGYGPLKVEALRIGETPLADYEGVEVETRMGLDGEPPLTLVPNDVYEDSVVAALEGPTGGEWPTGGGWVSHVSQAEADEISVDFGFGGGLVSFDGMGQKSTATVALEVQVSPVGLDQWTHPTWDPPLLTSTGSPGEAADFDGPAYLLANPDVAHDEYFAANPWQHYVEHGRSEGRTAYWKSQTHLAGYIDVTASTTASVRMSARWKAPRGQYSVRARRLTAKSTSSQVVDACTWTILRTVTNEPPVSMPGLAMTALRIKATDQLNGAVDQLNGIVTSIAPDYDYMTASWVTRPTNNPASLIRLVLQGRGNARPLPDSRIDLAGLEDFHDECRLAKRTYNQIRDFRTSIWDTLADIAAAGRASPAQRNGRWGVVVDRPQVVPAQHFTPRNSWGFEVEHHYLDLPHGWRVRFVDEDADWKADERIVYDDGYTVDNASKFEGLELPGVTNRDQLWKDGRFHIASARLRNARYTFNADIEHLVCTRGDLVLVTHDVIATGLASARLRGLTLDDVGRVVGMHCDEDLPMEPGKSYGVSIRTASDMALVVSVMTTPGITRALLPLTPIPAASAPEVGDLLGFGELGNITRDLLVLSLEPGQNHSCKITCMDSAPAVYSADTGPIPSHTGLNPLPGAKVPLVYEVRSDEDVLEALPNGTLVPQIAVTLGSVSARASIITGVELQLRRAGQPTWERLVTVPGHDVRQVTVDGVVQAQAYEFRLRFATASGYGTWSTTYSHTVVGMANPPPDPTGATLEGPIMRWTHPSMPRDFAGWRVHVAPGVAHEWSAGAPIVEGLVPTNHLDVGYLLDGSPRVLMVRAEDQAGNLSLGLSYVTVGLGDPMAYALRNEVTRLSYAATGFGPWVRLTGGSLTGGILAATDLSADPYLPTAGSLYLPDGSGTYLPVTIDGMTWEVEYVIPTSARAAVDDLLVQISASGLWSLRYKVGTDPAYLGVPDAPYLPDPVEEYLPYSHSHDWLPWPGRLRVPEGADAIRLQFKTAAGTVRGQLLALDVVVDAPTVIEKFEDLWLPATGARLLTAKNWRKISTVRVSLQDSGTAATYVHVLDKDVLGPLLQGFDSSGTGTLTFIDAEIQGW